MRLGGFAFILLALSACASVAIAQSQPPSDVLEISGSSVFTWTDAASNAVQVEGPVTINLEHGKLTADRAVVWISPDRNGLPDQQNVDIALMGHADAVQEEVTRSGDQLLVTAKVRGRIRLVANERAARDLSDSDLYREASRLRAGANAEPATQEEPTTAPVTRPAESDEPTPRAAATQPTAAAANGLVIPPSTRPTEPVIFQAGTTDTVQTEQGKMAIVLSGGVTLMQHRANGDVIELRSERAVLFTPLTGPRELEGSKKFHTIEDAVQSAYLEGDVRISYQPVVVLKMKMGEQRLTGNRVYYEFASMRAILTDAVLHTVDPQRGIPAIMRAQTIRQLAEGEYAGEKVQLTTSSFATPSFAIAADRAYVRQTASEDVTFGTQTEFVAHDATFRAEGVPFFYLPVMAGTITEHGMPLRDLEFENSRRFGFGMLTEWGLFETLGKVPPHDLDLTYRLDYLSDRGPAVGVDAKYGGGIIDETTKEPWNFQGDVKSYMVIDHGEDDLGGDRLNVDPDKTVRGRFLWEHEHFFPDDWQLQLRAGLVSDPTFMEEWFEHEFDTGLPQDISVYLKRQRNTEAFTMLLEFQPNGFVTTADQLQEGFEVERLPELSYHRIGDSFGDDSFTFFSSNTLSALKFKQSDASLSDLGFRPGTIVTPGLPALGTTGVTNDVTLRGDFRQEMDYPFSLGQFRVVPYVMGRYTAYSDTPSHGADDRALAGAGVRMTTAIWKVDNSIESELFDLHRVRHIIEPEINLFTSAASADRSEFFIYDEDIDAINDISAAQFALHQRWQTKRGGPGRWRNVDFFELNVEANLFANKPPDASLNPLSFRSLFFPSEPEASVPRNGINADALWRLSDSFVILSDAQYNLDKQNLATASIGIAVRHDERLSYFVGTRYIEDLNSNITTVAANYQLSTKYYITGSESFDFGEQKDVAYAVGITRLFDRLTATVSVRYDATNNDSGITFNIYPTGLRRGLASDSVGSVFGPKNQLPQ